MPAVRPSHPRTAARLLSAPYLIFGGLLLVAIVADVACLIPPKSPGSDAHILYVHQRLSNYLLAEKLVSPLLPGPPTRWLRLIQCEKLGNGVWGAVGVVGVDSGSPDRKEIPTTWRAAFIPETGETLYRTVGDKTSGSIDEALRRAGVPAENQ